MSDKHDDTYWPIGVGVSDGDVGAWLEAGRTVEVALYRPDILNLTLSEGEAVALCGCLGFCLNELYGHKDISDERR